MTSGGQERPERPSYFTVAVCHLAGRRGGRQRRGEGGGETS